MGDTEGKHERGQTADTARYRRLKEAGICVTCGKREARPGHIRCKHCARLYTKRERERRALLAKYHLCTTCKKELPKDYPHTRCEECLKKSRSPRNAGYVRSLRARRIAAGECVYCGVKLEAGETHRDCERCRKRRSSKERKRRARRTKLGLCRLCDEPTTQGKPYCERHLQMYYETMQKRRRKRESQKAQKEYVR